MQQSNNQILQLQSDQLEWLLNFKDIRQVKDLIDRKAFKRNYFDIVLLLDSV